jgi:hypothetical protein
VGRSSINVIDICRRGMWCRFLLLLLLLWVVLVLLVLVVLEEEG